MADLIEPLHPFEFIATEANGRRSRDNAILISGQNLKTARILGTITASGKYTAVAPAANDGSQVASGILGAGVDATSGEKTCVVVARDCEVNRAELDFGALDTGQIATAISQLKAVGILVRPAV